MTTKRSIERFAFATGSIFLIVSIVVSSWWYGFAKHSSFEELSPATIARIETIQDIEQLRRTAVILANGRVQIARDLKVLTTDFVNGLSIIALFAGACLIVCGARIHREQRINARDV